MASPLSSMNHLHFQQHFDRQRADPEHDEAPAQRQSEIARREPQLVIPQELRQFVNKRRHGRKAAANPRRQQQADGGAQDLRGRGQGGDHADRQAAQQVDPQRPVREGDRVALRSQRQDVAQHGPDKPARADQENGPE